jgi:hypothetical protein
MLFHDDVVAERQAEPGAFAGRLRREERIKYFSPDRRADTGTVVTHADLHLLPKVTRGKSQRRFKIFSTLFGALVGGIESVADQVEQNADEFLREYFQRAGIR